MGGGGVCVRVEGGGWLGVEKGSSLKASLRYSWSELRFHLACSPTQSAYIALGAKNI